ncbi:MAG: proline--tRNA ligase, partial [candidate division Zixibacteria bacterium]|nr:proline--tRNA ligase [candidate division Zixibacteria bacterium]
NNQVGAVEIELAQPEVVEKVTGCPVGYAGPIGMAQDIPLYVDNEVLKMKNFVIGANKNEMHKLNVNIDRDFKATKVGDLIDAPEGEMCPNCDGSLHAKKGIEVGNTFMLGTKYSESLSATFTDADGNEKPFLMGSYGIGITRTPQAAIERYHDDHGIKWPKNIAPFLVEIIPLNYAKDEHKEAADKFYDELTSNGIDCLLDDRTERAGVKFNDADLIGIPIQLIIGDKSLKQGKIEVKNRQTGEKSLIEMDNLTENVKKLLEQIN